MKNYTLRFRAVDTSNFDDLEVGVKSIETRAGSKRYCQVNTGDQLTIVCGKERLIKIVKKAHYFKTLGALLKTLPLKKIMPHLNTDAEARKQWNSYPGYKDRIKEFGIVAWELK